MFFGKYGTFTGGIDLPDEKHLTLHRPISPCRPLERLRVPLAPCGGEPAQPLVKLNQHVPAGEQLAMGARGGVDVFAPLSGRVSAFVTAAVAVGDGFVACPAIEMVNLSAPQPIRPLKPLLDWRDAAPAALRNRLVGGGLTTCRQPVQPVARWIDHARGRRCRTLICNAMENQPCVTADHRLLTEHGHDVIRGLAMLGRALEISRIILAVDHRRTDDYRELVGAARIHSIIRVALPHKYPIGAEPLLVKVLAGKEVPLDGTAADVGVAVTDAATCFAAYRWAACGVPLTARIVTLGGDRCPSPANAFMPFGAECHELMDAAEPPVIHGGAMVGARCPAGAVVGPGTDAILAPAIPRPAAPTACIRCGWCTDYCPARLNVAAMNDFFELGRLEQARRGGACACVECGVCSYICPARLPLAQRVKQLKRFLREERRQMPLFPDPSQQGN